MSDNINECEQSPLEVGTIRLSLYLTRYDAEQIVNNPRGAIARRAHKALYEDVKKGAEMFVNAKRGDRIYQAEILDDDEVNNS